MAVKDLTERLWVPWINIFTLPKGDPRYEAPLPSDVNSWRADTPAGVEIAVVDSSFDDLIALDGSKPVTHVEIVVSLADKPKVTSAVLYKDIPEKTRLMVEMYNTCRSDWEHTAATFFQAIPNIGLANAARLRIIKDVLLQGVVRGLIARTGETIRSTYNMPSAGMTGNVDTEIYDAAQKYLQRSSSLSAQDAVARLDRQLNN